MVPTGKLGKMGVHFPVREKSENFEHSGKVRNLTKNTGKVMAFSKNTGKVRHF